MKILNRADERNYEGNKLDYFKTKKNIPLRERLTRLV